MSESYEAILATVPEVTWAMPADAPGHVDVARRNEYVEDALRKAAEIVWLPYEAMTYTDSEVTITDEELAVWMKYEIACLRQMLTTWGPMSGLGSTRRDFWRRRALQIVNLPRVLASSSAMRERGQ